MNRLPNFGGYTPSDLENMGMDFLLHLALTAERSVSAEPNRSADGPSASQHGVPPFRGSVGSLVNRGSSIAHPEALTADQTVNRKSRIVHRRPRSKAFHLPPEIQLSLNAMLAAGRRYTEIIHCLNDRGYPGFNKVNLHNWKATGYQGWLRAKNPEVTT